MSDTRVIQNAVRAISERSGTPWELGDRLPGGYSAHGAHLLRSNGRRAVLKFHPPGRSEGRLSATAEVIAAAIAAGWRTPRWLEFGLLPDGEWFVIEEFIDGSQPCTLGETELDLLLETNRHQAGLRPVIEADWSRYVHRTVTTTSPESSRMRTRGDTRALLERLLAICAYAGSVELPTTDLVHGDFTLENTLLCDGRAYLVDAEYIGKGTRAYDLATLLVHAGTGDLGAAASTVDRLRDECDAIVGKRGSRLCVATRIIGLAHFGFDHWPSDLPSFVGRCNAFLDRFGSAWMSVD